MCVFSTFFMSTCIHLQAFTQILNTFIQDLHCLVPKFTLMWSWNETSLTHRGGDGGKLFGGCKVAAYTVCIYLWLLCIDE